MDQILFPDRFYEPRKPGSAVGIDPGSTGGIVRLALNQSGLLFAERHVLPQADNQGSSQPHVPVLANMLRVWQSPVWCEDCYFANRKTNPTTLIHMAKNLGRIAAASQLVFCPLEFVAPQSWQSKIFTPGRSNKGATKAGSFGTLEDLGVDLDELIPPGCRVPHDGIADAHLIALFGLLAQGCIIMKQADKMEAPKRVKQKVG
jgi:hypothetical protein